MDAFELRARARQEADELGPEPPASDAELWREERWGAVVLLAGLADDDAALLRQAANQTASEWTDREAARMLLDAAKPSPRSAPSEPTVGGDSSGTAPSPLCCGFKQRAPWTRYL
jgi:hypothetical protein